jgi:hypothetical protein
MQLPTVGLPSDGTALADAVQEIPHHLVGDEQAQQAAATRARKRPKKCGAVSIATLVIQRLERIPSDYLVRYLRGVDPPLTEIADYGRYTPDELAGYTPEEGVELARR